MTIDITAIIAAVIGLLGTIITAFVVPYIKTKLTSEQFVYLDGVIKTAVYAAEILFSGNGRGEEKLNYVLEYTQGVCEAHKITFDKEQVRQLIEKSWTELKVETTELKKGE